MKTERCDLWHVIRNALAILTLAALVSCGSPPPQGGDQGDDAEPFNTRGSVALPAGHGIDLAGLTVITPLGAYPVSTTGAFGADIFDGAVTELGIETEAGELLLLGVTSGGTVDVSLASTAEALLYYAIGGMWLPPGQQDTLRSLLAGVPEIGTLEAQLQRQLLDGGNGVAAPDRATLDALAAVHASLVGTAEVAALWAGAGTGLRPAAEGDANILINPSSGIRAGIEMLHSPSGSGVVAQNHFRRPAALLVYETGWEDADGNLTENDPPLPVATVDIPATGQLEFFEAILDIVTAESPWSPVLSPTVSLPGHAGAERTHFELVVVGPSGSDLTLPIMEDPRFDIFHGHWEDIELEKAIELFLDELLLPLVEVAGLGARAHIDASRVNDLRRRVRLIHDEHLAGLGVLLRNRQGGMVDALKYAIKELVENRNFRLDLLDAVGDALKQSERNRFQIDAAEKRLASRASASSIAAAVETLLVGGDVTKIASDLNSAFSVVAWSAVSAPALFFLEPPETTVSKYYTSARLSVGTRGESEGAYLYRWTNSADFGSISDLLDEAPVLTTTDPEIWYFHDDPAHIRDTDVDTVTVEVFEVDEGSVSVPPGAQPITRLVATIRGEDIVLPPGVTIEFGTTEAVPGPDAPEASECAAMFYRFPKVAGAQLFVLRITGIRITEHYGHGASTNSGFNVGKSFAGPLTPHNALALLDVCKWRTHDGQVLERAPRSVVLMDPGADDPEYVVNIFTITSDWRYVREGDVTVRGAVADWVRWIADATFTLEHRH